MDVFILSERDGTREKVFCYIVDGVQMSIAEFRKRYPEWGPGDGSANVRYFETVEAPEPILPIV